MTRRALYFICTLLLCAGIVFGYAMCVSGCGMKGARFVGDQASRASAPSTAAPDSTCPYRVTGLSGAFAQYPDSMIPTGGTTVYMFMFDVMEGGGGATSATVSNLSASGDDCRRPPYHFFQVQWRTGNTNPPQPWTLQWQEPVGREWDEWVVKKYPWRYYLPYQRGRKQLTKARYHQCAVIFHVPWEIRQVRVTLQPEVCE